MRQLNRCNSLRQCLTPSSCLININLSSPLLVYGILMKMCNNRPCFKYYQWKQMASLSYGLEVNESPTKRPRPVALTNGWIAKCTYGQCSPTSVCIRLPQMALKCRLWALSPECQIPRSRAELRICIPNKSQVALMLLVPQSHFGHPSTAPMYNLIDLILCHKTAKLCYIHVLFDTRLVSYMFKKKIIIINQQFLRLCCLCPWES